MTSSCCPPCYPSPPAHARPRGLHTPALPCRHLHVALPTGAGPAQAVQGAGVYQAPAAVWAQPRPAAASGAGAAAAAAGWAGGSAARAEAKLGTQCTVTGDSVTQGVNCGSGTMSPATAFSAGPLWARPLNLVPQQPVLIQLAPAPDHGARRTARGGPVRSGLPAHHSEHPGLRACGHMDA